MYLIVLRSGTVFRILQGEVNFPMIHLTDSRDQTSCNFECTNLFEIALSWLQIRLKIERLALHQGRQLTRKAWTSQVLTFNNPGALSISPLALHQWCCTGGVATILGRSFGKFGPSKTVMEICRPPEVNVVEYSSFSFMTWTLKRQKTSISPKSFYAKFPTPLKQERKTNGAQTDKRTEQKRKTYLSLKIFNVSICRFLKSGS